MTYENSLGAKIKQSRKAKGLTQEQLAELMGIDDKHLSRIEKGFHSPKFSIIQKLAKVLEYNFLVLEDVCVQENSTKEKIIRKILHILNSADSETEELCYLEAIKHARRCYKSGQSSLSN